MKRKLYILGDININEKPSQVVNYLNATESNGAIQLITKPTKLTDRTATVIDHTITNDKIHKLCPYVLPANITDHYPTIWMIDNLKIIKNNIKKMSFQIEIENLLIHKFFDKKLGKLVSNNLPLIMLFSILCFDKFVAQITKIIDKHAPLKRLSRKQKNWQKSHR